MNKRKGKHYLLPGEFHFTDEAINITTVLGSCVAITVWHPELRIGGMCHFVLPYSTPKNKALAVRIPKPEGYYGDSAMKLFEAASQSRGLQLNQFHAKVFGGSNVLDIPDLKSNKYIGVQNAEAAFRLVQLSGMSVHANHIGLGGSRRIKFDVYTGDVWLSHQQQTGFNSIKHTRKS